MQLLHKAYDSHAACTNCCKDPGLGCAAHLTRFRVSEKSWGVVLSLVLGPEVCQDLQLPDIA